MPFYNLVYQLVAPITLVKKNNHKLVVTKQSKHNSTSFAPLKELTTIVLIKLRTTVILLACGTITVASAGYASIPVNRARTNRHQVTFALLITTVANQRYTISGGILAHNLRCLGNDGIQCAVLLVMHESSMAIHRHSNVTKRARKARTRRHL
jgi:hypothetical protein